MKKIFLSFSFSILFLSILTGQKTITGVVVDEIGIPLPGASVVEVGTTNGVSTDFDGNYTISVDENSSLEFSFVGYGSITILVGEQDKIDVTLNPSNELAEVVVVGYGSQKKVTLTDNVARVTSEDLSDVPTPNLFNAITGRVAGVQINQTNGKVEAGLNFRIRGQSSISAGSDPLYVLDGVPLINDDESSNGAPTNPLITLNPSEIESIDILKDASAAIYGARAANGVILITTKRGSEGKAKVKITSNYGWQNFTTTPDMLTGAEYMDLVNLLNVYKLPVAEWAAANAVRGQPFTRPNGEVLNPTYSTDRIENTRAGTDPWLYPDTDWMEAVQRKNAPTTRQNVQITGGDENVRYLASAGYLRQDVNFKNAPKGFTQYDLRLNLDAKINDFLIYYYFIH